MLAQPIRLSDVFLSPNFGPTEPQCTIYDTDPLDELEYGLGVERGWLLSSMSKESEHFGMIWEEINEDLCIEIECGRIALLPDTEVISKMLELLQHNYYCPLRERIPFFEELPLTEYTYTLLPPFLPSPRPLYIKHNDTFSSPPSLPGPITKPTVKIQTRLHPLILLNHTAQYAAFLRSRPHFHYLVDQETCELLMRADTPSFGRVQESWLNLGDVEGNRRFLDRHVVYYIPDIVRAEKKKKVKRRVKVKTDEGEAKKPVARKVRKVEQVLVSSE